MKHAYQTVPVLRFALLAFMCLAVIGLSACSGPFSRGGDGETTLEGFWVQSNSPSDTDHQAIYIHGKSIEIYWILGEDAALYWAGSFQPPANLGASYKWKSEADEARTTDSLFTTREKMKEFEFVDGQLTYKVTVNEVSTTVYAEREEWDYEAARAGDKTEINYYDYIDTQYAMIRDLDVRTIIFDAINERLEDIQETVTRELTEAVNESFQVG